MFAAHTSSKFSPETSWLARGGSGRRLPAPKVTSQHLPASEAKAQDEVNDEQHRRLETEGQRSKGYECLSKQLDIFASYRIGVAVDLCRTDEKSWLGQIQSLAEAWSSGSMHVSALGKRDCKQGVFDRGLITNYFATR